MIRPTPRLRVIPSVARNLGFLPTDDVVLQSAILDSSLRFASFRMTVPGWLARFSSMASGPIVRKLPTPISPRGEKGQEARLSGVPLKPALRFGEAGDGFPPPRERRFGCTGRWPRLARLGSGPLIPSSSSGQAPPSPARGEGVRGTCWAAGRVQTQMSVRLGGGMPASRLLSISLFTQTLSPFGVERRRRLGRSRRYDLGSAGAYSQMYLP